jgi:hypothetical protein
VVVQMLVLGVNIDAFLDANIGGNLDASWWYEKG